MKFYSLIVLIASVSAIRLEKSNLSDGTFAEGKAIAAKVVAAQQAFEANHVATHAAAMAAQAQQCFDKKASVVTNEIV